MCESCFDKTQQSRGDYKRGAGKVSHWSSYAEDAGAPVDLSDKIQRVLHLKVFKLVFIRFRKTPNNILYGFSVAPM